MICHFESVHLDSFLPDSEICGKSARSLCQESTDPFTATDEIHQLLNRIYIAPFQGNAICIFFCDDAFFKKSKRETNRIGTTDRIHPVTVAQLTQLDNHFQVIV